MKKSISVRFSWLENAIIKYKHRKLVNAKMRARIYAEHAQLVHFNFWQGVFEKAKKKVKDDKTHILNQYDLYDDFDNSDYGIQLLSQSGAIKITTKEERMNEIIPKGIRDLAEKLNTEINVNEEEGKIELGKSKEKIIH